MARQLVLAVALLVVALLVVGLLVVVLAVAQIAALLAVEIQRFGRCTVVSMGYVELVQRILAS